MKPHYPILDGLRSTAAILVVIYHLLEACFLGITANHPMRHGYLASAQHINIGRLLLTMVVSFTCAELSRSLRVIRIVHFAGMGGVQTL